MISYSFDSVLHKSRSPKFLVHRTISAAVSQTNGVDSTDGGMNWLMFELLWRDFFRYHIGHTTILSPVSNEILCIHLC